MKRTILTGILALAASVAVVMAQQGQPAPAGQAAPAVQPGQAAQPAPAAPAGPQAKSPEELAARNALIAAMNKNDGDAVIKAAEDLLAKFADTQFKEMALTLEATAYSMKSDTVNEQLAWGRVLEVNPKSIDANLKLGGLIAKQTRDKDLDRDDQLAKAEKYLNAAIDNLKVAQKPNPQLPDQVWEQVKKQNDAEAHEGLGMVALTRAVANKDADPKKYDKAIGEMQIAATEDPEQTAYEARLASVLQSAGRNSESIALCDKILAVPDLNPAIKTFATNLRAAAEKAAAPPAK